MRSSDFMRQSPIFKKILTRKSSGDHQAKKKKKRRKKPTPEEQEGMPQHQHCPPERRRADKNPECHEYQSPICKSIFTYEY
jgi:hypothetical protein